jgi:hypothetical protein
MARAPMDLFQEAVRATVMRWTALNLAVSYEFGDGHSENHRREELIQQTVAGFASAHAANKRWEYAPRTRPGPRAVRFFSPSGACPPANTRRTFRLPPRGGRPAYDALPLVHRAPDPTELEDFLDTYLQDHLNLFADDDSPHEVSVLICRLYELIVANRILEAQQLLSTPTAALDACVSMVRTLPLGCLPYAPCCRVEGVCQQ